MASSARTNPWADHHQPRPQASETTPLIPPSRSAQTAAGYGAHRQSTAGSGDDDDDDHDHEHLAEHEQQRRKRGEATPLPWLQLSVLCLMRMTEPISFTVIFPFVTQMLHENLPDIPPEQLGYYAGLVESAFALVQFCTIMFWCRLSDSIGRKPVLLIGLTGSFISVNSFGLSRSYPMMIASRSILGLMNGNIAVIKSMLAEITDDSNQARAFTLLPVSFAIGSIIGPSMGGYLSHPVETFPSVFGGWTFLERHPFWLPCGVAAFLNVLAMLLGTFCLRETLPAKERKSILPAFLRRRLASVRENNDDAAAADGSSSPSSSSSGEDEKPSLRSLLTQQTTRVLGTQFCLNLLNSCYAAIVPLFCYESIQLGGLGWSNVDIGTFLAFNGVVGIVNQLVFFPYLERRWGSPIAVYRRVTVFFPLVFACLPLAHAAARAHPHSKAWPAVALAAGTLARSVANMSIVCSVILINNSAPTRNSLGSLNGLSQMFGCLSRTLGPTTATSLFALSTSKHILDGQFVWFCLVLLATLTWYLTLLVRAPPVAAWRLHEQKKRRLGQEEQEQEQERTGRPVDGARANEER